MLDISHVKGILMAPDGSSRSFGIHSDAPASKLTDINFHDCAFRMNVSRSKWFKTLQRRYGLIYNNYSLMRQGIGWAAKGMVLFVHVGANPVDVYYVLSPSQMSLKQRKIFEDNYENLYRQIVETGSSFEGYIFDPNGQYNSNGMIFGLDEFYQSMGMKNKDCVSRHHL